MFNLILQRHYLILQPILLQPFQLLNILHLVLFLLQLLLQPTHLHLVQLLHTITHILQVLHLGKE